MTEITLKQQWATENAYAQLKDHFLVQILNTHRFQAFYMKSREYVEKEMGRIMSTLFIFHPEGITIAGDLTPGRNGNCSALGYGVGWFGSRKSEDYLCEKFLPHEWHHELANLELEVLAEEVRKGEHDDEYPQIRNHWDNTVAMAKYKNDEPPNVGNTDDWNDSLNGAREEVADDIESQIRSLDESTGPDALYHWWTDQMGHESESMPGYGYDPRERMWLCALQKRFAELYQEMEAKEEAVTPASVPLHGEV